MKNLLPKFILLTLLVMTSTTGLGQQLNYVNGRVALGLNYPGGAVKLGFANNFALELRGQVGEKINTIGGRVYLNLNPQSLVMFYLGGEYDNVTFENQKTKGNGTYLDGFTGFELFFSSNVSFNTDIGYGTMNLKDGNTNVTNSKDYLIANVGLNLYLSPPKSMTIVEPEEKPAEKERVDKPFGQGTQGKPTPTEIIPKKQILIAVVDFGGRNVDSMTSAVVSDFVREVLVKDGRYQIVDRNNMELIMAEQKFQMTGCTTTECAVQIGRLLNVQKIVIGNLARLETIFYITVSVINIENSQVIYSDSSKCRSADDLDTVSKDLARRVANSLGK